MQHDKISSGLISIDDIRTSLTEILLVIRKQPFSQNMNYSSSIKFLYEYLNPHNLVGRIRSQLSFLIDTEQKGAYETNWLPLF